MEPTALQGNRSIDTSPGDDEFRAAPPSPTLSTQSSVHFMTSMDLQENRPSDGTGSLALLSPTRNSHSHSRRPSNAMTDDEGAVADRFPVPFPLPPTTSHATTSVRSIVYTSNSRMKVKGGAEMVPEGEGDDDEDKDIELDLTQDEHIDPTPFAFKPYYLTSLIDNKSLELLEAIGGINGLLAGLGIDSTNGLNVGGERSESKDASVVVTTTPTCKTGETEGELTHEGATYTSTAEDRRRVYGSNVLPVRRSRSLLKLMWLALKDKALVGY